MENTRQDVEINYDEYFLTPDSEPKSLLVMASKNVPMPEDLNLPQQAYYGAIRNLYASYRNGSVTKEQATTEKTSIIRAFEEMCLGYDRYSRSIEMHLRLSSVLIQNRNECEVCQLVARILDGRDKASMKEAIDEYYEKRKKANKCSVCGGIENVTLEHEDKKYCHKDVCLTEYKKAKNPTNSEGKESVE